MVLVATAKLAKFALLRLQRLQRLIERARLGLRRS